MVVAFLYSLKPLLFHPFDTFHPHFLRVFSELQKHASKEQIRSVAGKLW